MHDLHGDVTGPGRSRVGWFPGRTPCRAVRRLRHSFRSIRSDGETQIYKSRPERIVGGGRGGQRIEENTMPTLLIGIAAVLLNTPMTDTAWAERLIAQDAQDNECRKFVPRWRTAPRVNNLPRADWVSERIDYYKQARCHGFVEISESIMAGARRRAQAPVLFDGRHDPRVDPRRARPARETESPTTPPDSPTPPPQPPPPAAVHPPSPAIAMCAGDGIGWLVVRTRQDHLSYVGGAPTSSTRSPTDLPQVGDRLVFDAAAPVGLHTGPVPCLLRDDRHCAVEPASGTFRVAGRARFASGPSGGQRWQLCVTRETTS
jgi:hypothetical protein